MAAVPTTNNIVGGPGGAALQAPGMGPGSIPQAVQPYIGPYSLEYYNNLQANPGMQKPPVVSTSKTAKNKVAGITASLPKAAPIPTQVGADGLPIPPATKLDQYSTDMKATDTSLQSAYDDYKKTISDINTGSVPLSSNEQALLTSLQQSFDRQKITQEKANKSYEGVLAMSGARDGLARYSPVQYEQGIARAVSEGAQKIQDIDQEAVLKINETKQALFDKKYKVAKEAYDEYTSLLKTKRDTIKDTYEKVYQNEKDLRDYGIQLERLNMDKQKLPYELAKLQMDILKGKMDARGATTFSDSQLKQIDSSPETKKLQALKDLKNKLNAYRIIAAQPEKFDVIGSRRAIADSLYADLKIAYKEAANLGALTGPDVSIIQQAIKPTSGGILDRIGYATSGGQKGTLGSIDTALKTLNTQQQTYGKTLTTKWGADDPYIRNIIGADDPSGSKGDPDIKFQEVYTDPDKAALIDSIVSENPGYGSAEVLEILGIDY